MASITNSAVSIPLPGPGNEGGDETISAYEWRALFSEIEGGMVNSYPYIPALHPVAAKRG